MWVGEHMVLSRRPHCIVRYGLSPPRYDQLLPPRFAPSVWLLPPRLFHAILPSLFLLLAAEMDLALPLARTIGRASRPVGGALVRELTPSDIEALGQERGTQPEAIKRIGQRHHALAKLLAGGMKDGEAAAIVGYTLSRVSVLKGDPTFRELVAFYKESVDAEYLQLHEALAGLSVDAANEVRRRLEDDPESLTIMQLSELVKMGADRTGHGPSSSTSVSVNLNIGSRLEEARKRVAARQLTIEGEVLESTNG